jgi:hypothetical protein
MKYLLLCCCLTNLLLADNFYYEFDKKVELKNVIKSDSLSSNDEIQEYVTTSGEAVKFKNEILVQCEKDKYCEDDFESLNLSNRTKLSEDFYLIKLDQDQDIFELCQELYNLEDVKSAHPNFIKSRFKK